MKTYKVLVKVESEEDIKEIIELALSEEINGKKVSRAFIVDNILHMIVED